MIDPNEAPEGYFAVPRLSTSLCGGCEFFDLDAECPPVSCVRPRRRDGEEVVFIPKEPK